MLAALVVAVGVLAQSPSQMLQAQQQHEIAVRAEEQQREILRQQREQVEREHATELLLQRRAAAVALTDKHEEVVARLIERTQAAPRASQPPLARVPPRPDFSLPLMGRSIGAGLLAGLCAFLLGRFIQQRLPA